MNRQTFVNRPKMKGLSNAEKEKRWKQHLQNMSTKKNRRVPRERGNRTNTVLPCTLHYTAALLDPFDYSGEMPCVPDMHTIPSYKYRQYARGEFSTGTNGKGFIMVNPLL
jgi:hypothetical protein